MNIRVKKFEINGFVIKCASAPTHNGFKHFGEIVGGVYAKAKICYLNRTYESYTYESLIYDLVNKAIKLLKKEEKSDYNLKVMERLEQTLKALDSHNESIYNNIISIEIDG